MIIGDARLQQNLSRLSKMGIDRIIRKQAERVRSAAVQLCPADTGELRNSIRTKNRHEGGGVQGVVYTNKEYAAYVEFGTGPKGEADHAGISPEVAVSYRQDPWTYQDNDGNWHWNVTGQAAQPYMYPALKNMEQSVQKQIREDVAEAIRRNIK